MWSWISFRGDSQRLQDYPLHQEDCLTKINNLSFILIEAQEIQFHPDLWLFGQFLQSCGAIFIYF